MVIRDLGLQVKTVTYGGKETSRFIDKSQIADVIINEGVTMQKVIFYMAIMIEGQDKMVVVFEVRSFLVFGRLAPFPYPYSSSSPSSFSSFSTAPEASD